MSSDNRPQKQTLLNSILGFVFKTLLLLIVSLLLSITVEYLGMFFEYWDASSRHSEEMLKDEFNYANHDIKRAVSEGVILGWSGYVAYHLSIFSSYSFELITYFISILPLDFGSDIVEFVQAAENITIVFILRLFLVVFSFPLFLMVFIWAFVDGLVERDLRRFGAGRESSTIFDGVRRMVFPCLALPFIVYLSFPVSINPLFIIIPSALVQAVLYRMLFAKYKKYL